MMLIRLHTFLITFLEPCAKQIPGFKSFMPGYFERIIQNVPTVNIYYKDQRLQDALEQSVSHIKYHFAKALTGKNIRLGPDEISVRFLRVGGSGMLARVEVEINAAAFEERVENQDEICLDIQKYLLGLWKIDDVKVWLILSELGHSWQDT